MNRLLPLMSVAIVAVLGTLALGGCGEADSKDQARRAHAIRARVLRERAARVRAEKLRERRARKRRAERRARQSQTPDCGPGLISQGGYCVVPPPSGGGQPSAPPTDKTPSVDSAEGQQQLKQDPDCKDAPPPPPSYHGPVQC
jgi:hypothetical protein